MKIYLRKNNGNWGLFEGDLRKEFKSRHIRVGANVKIEDEACLDSNISLGDVVRVSAFGQINRGVKLGEGVFIGHRTRVQDNAKIGALVSIGNYTMVGNGVVISPRTCVGNRVTIKENAMIGTGVTIGNGAVIGRGVEIGASSTIGEAADIDDGVEIDVGVTIGACARIGQRAVINNTRDCMVMGPIGSRDDILTCFRHGKKLIVATGCFTGTLEEFEDRVKTVYVRYSLHRNHYMAAIAFFRVKFRARL